MPGPVPECHRGFSLIEMVVVLALLAVVTAGAGVYARSFFTSSSDMSGSALMDRVALAEQQVASTYGSYTPDPEDLTGRVGDVPVVTGALTAPGTVSVAVSDDGSVVLVTVSSGGACLGRVLAPAQSGGGATSSTVPNTQPCAPAQLLPAGHAALPVASVRP